ncbi:signal recognition particle 72 [Anaeramoeba flamelloides]|uniref:Signal recognition particle subunit SRP72 n=1 Tax=Anaeramoeba flamelloides TaxID=1746091 RepID=A0ABQ8YUB8_9EUKA|nr:signal recognition particle 72 [Anaeramoeba flamelloides]
MSENHELYRKLNSQINEENFKEAIKTCNKLISKKTNEFEPLQCKFLCNLHLSKFQECVNLSNNNPIIKEKMIFELAYCFYRLNKNEQAIKLLNKTSEESIDILHLRAQLLYRQEKYFEAFEIYQKIWKEYEDDSFEIFTNLTACFASYFLSSGKVFDYELDTESFIEKHGESYELLYNCACIAAGKKTYSKAVEYLELSKTKCIETLKEEVSELELNTELAEIDVQIGYVQQQLGNHQVATEIYEKILHEKIAGKGISLVASNNLAQLHGTKDLFSSYNKTKSISNRDMRSLLLGKQREIIGFNRCLLLLLMNKKKECISLFTNLKEEFPNSDLPELIYAGIKFHEKKIPEAKDILEKALKNSDSMTIKLSLVHLDILQGNLLQASKRLSTIPEILQTPAVVSLRVMLLEDANQIEEAHQVIQNAADYWIKKKKKNQNQQYLKEILTLLANFNLDQDKPKNAIVALEKLVNLDPQDFDSLARLVLISSKFDVDKSEKYAKKIIGLDFIINSNEKKKSTNLNVDELEKLPPPDLSEFKKKIKKTKVNKAKVTDEKNLKSKNTQKKRKKKKRSKRLPKNFNPKIKPDPERWLPKWQRKAYRKYNKNREFRGTQGTVTSSASNTRNTQTTTKKTSTNNRLRSNKRKKK